MIKFTVISPPKNYLTLGNLAKFMFWSILFARLKSKHFSQFFWLEVNLRGLRVFILQKNQASVVERQKKEVHLAVRKKTPL